MTTYWFGPLPVVDPDQGGMLVPDADFQVFAFSDSGLTTPLTVQTRVGGSLASVTTLHSTSASLLDEFSVDDQPRVWVKSGSHVVLLASSQGLADAADASRAAAEAAAAAASAAADSAAAATAPTGAQIDSHLGGDATGLVNVVAGKADLDPATGKVMASQLPTIGGTVSDATSADKGVVRLSGDLGGTADAPTVPGLASKADDSAVVKLTGGQTVAGVKTFTSSPVVPDGSFTAQKLSATGTRDSTSYLRGDGIWATPPGAVVYGTTAGTAAQGNDSRFSDAASLTTGTVAAARLPAATEASPGTLEIATTGETTTGTLDNVIVTPLKLKAVADTKAALSHTHTAVDLPASIPHDVWQPSGGTWPARPTVPSGARVNAIGYPGLTDVPSWLVSGTDSYTMRTA